MMTRSVANLFNISAPTAESREEEIDRFFSLYRSDQHSERYKKKSDAPIVAGNQNAKIGTDRSLRSGWERVIWESMDWRQKRKTR